MREDDLMPSVQVRLTEFSNLIEQYTRDFIGREWLIEQVDELFDDPTCHFVVLTGGAGVGKSAFMAYLAAIHPQWPRYFIRRDSRALLRPGDAKTFLLTIGGQLATLHPDLFKPENLEVVVRQRIGHVDASGAVIGVRIQELQTSPFYRVAIQAEQEIEQVAGKATGVEIGRLVSEPRQMSMQDLQYLGLLDPAWLLYQTDPDARIVVLVDALDELRYSPAEEDILRALVELPVEPSDPHALNTASSAKKLDGIPPNLRFVVSSRKEQFLDRLLGRSDAHELPLNVVGGKNLMDLRTYAEANLPGEELDPYLEYANTTKEELLKDLLGKAAGNFLYLRSVVDAIWEALSVPAKHDRLEGLLRVEALPEDLDSLYDYFLASIVDWIRRSGFGDAAWRQVLRPLLGTLAVAREPLSEKQLVAYTGLNGEDVGDLLRELRQFVEPVDDRQTYRIYHASFAEYLLDAESNLDYRIDGHTAHKRIVECYVDAWGGLEASLPGLQEPQKRNLHGGYGVRHLATHLEGANQVDLLHEILRLERPTGDDIENVWHAAREASGDTAGYLADVERAWRLAASASERSIEKTEPPVSMALEIRYALVTATVNSMAGNMPPTLLRGLVERGRWTCSQGFAYASQMADPVQRSEVMADLAQICKSLEDRAFREALTAVNSIEDLYWGEAAVARLAPRLPAALRNELLSRRPKAAQALIDAYSGGKQKHAEEHQPLEHTGEDALREALVTAGELAETAKVDRLMILLPLLKGPLLDDALVIARSIQEEFKRTLVMTALVLRMVELDRLPEALLASEEIAFLHNRTVALTRFIDASLDPVQVPSVQESLAAAQAIQDPYWRAAMLSELASRVPAESQDRLWQEALTATGTIGDEQQRADLIADLAVCLNDLGASSSALSVLETLEHLAWQAEALITLVPRLPENRLHSALTMARQMPENLWRAPCLASLAPRVAVSVRDQVWAEAVETAKDIPDVRRMVRALSGMLGALPDSLRPDVLEHLLSQIGSIENEHWRAEGLVQLALHLPWASLREALSAARSIADREARSQALAAIAAALARLGDASEAMRLATEEIDDMHWRQEALRALAQESPKPSQSSLALQATERLEYEHWKGVALSIQAPYIPTEQRMGLVTLARSITEPRQRALALARLSSSLPERECVTVLREAVAATQGIQEEREQARTLADLAPYISATLISEALPIVETMTSTANTEIALGALLPHLARSHQQEQAFDIATGIADDLQRARVMAHLCPDVTASQRQAMLPELVDVIQNATEAETQLELITSLTPYLKSMSAAEIYACWRAILHSLTNQSRPDLLAGLRALLPILIFLGTVELFESTEEAVQQVGSWWP